MAYDANNQARLGDKPELVAYFNAPQGYMLSIGGGSVTVTNGEGVVKLGPLAITGFDRGQSTNPKAWYLLDTSTLPIDTYTVAFQVSATGTLDGSVQILSYTIELNLLPLYEDTSSAYDPTTQLGQLRLLIGDTNDANFIFSDNELGGFLSLGGLNTQIAASLACESLANDAVKLTYAVQIGEYKKDATKLAGEYQARAIQLRKIAVVPGYTNSPEQRFRPRYNWFQEGNTGEYRW